MVKRFLILILALVLAGCGGDKGQGLVINPPNPHSGTTPSQGGGNEDNSDPGTEGQGGNTGTDPSISDPDAQRIARLGKTPVVAIYFTHYTQEEDFPTLEDVKCFTHINIGHVFFKNPKTGDGGLVIKSPDYVSRMAKYKSQYKDLKLLLFIGGWGKDADGFSVMARSASKRQSFCSECVRLCKEYNLDGVDIDWEYPTFPAEEDGYVNGHDESDTDNFTTLMKELREALGPDKLITYAASDDGYYINHKDVLEWVDFINVMTYSMGDPPGRHNSPLYMSENFANSRGGADCIENFNNKGVPYNRMNYGIGFYGHGDGKVYPSSVSYAMAREALEKGTVNGESVKGYNIRWFDDQSKSVYLGDSSGKMYASYEDEESISYRVDFVKKKGMLGAFVWEYREDDSDGTLRFALKRLMQ